MPTTHRAATAPMAMPRPTGTPAAALAAAETAIAAANAKAAAVPPERLARSKPWSRLPQLIKMNRQDGAVEGDGTLAGAVAPCTTACRDDRHLRLRPPRMAAAREAREPGRESCTDTSDVGRFFVYLVARKIKAMGSTENIHRFSGLTTAAGTPLLTCFAFLT